MNTGPLFTQLAGSSGSAPGAGTTAALIVPGDVVTKECTFTIGATGDERYARMAGKITAEELLRRYCSLVYSQTRNYEETARRLGLDRRTVKSKVAAAAEGAAEQSEPKRNPS